MKNFVALAFPIAALCCPHGVAVAADDSSAPPALRLAQAGPGPLEADYWRSAEKVGTPEAYQAYLAAFPKGFFAPLAKAALAKAGDTAPAPAPVSVSPAAAALQRIAGDADSSAVPFDIGDVYAGPGVLVQ